jgi:general stress protein 26
MDDMNKIEGMSESFKEAKIVMLTTFRDGEKISRPMTNFNEDPYEMIWFPTDSKSRKVDDIKKNPEVLVQFPSSSEGKYYEISGKAEFEEESVAAQKWKWWYLYWHPHQRRRFLFRAGDDTSRRTIINIHPTSARILSDT